MKDWILATIIAASFMTACGEELTEEEEANTASEEATVVEVSPETTVTPSLPTLPSGQESIATIKGKLGGEEIDLTWDFQTPTTARQCSGVDTVLTNGAITILGRSEDSGLAGTEVRMEGDWGSSNCAMSEDDWYIYLTIGHVNKNISYANGKKEAGIQKEPYVMLTAFKGPSNDTKYRNKENDSTNTGTTAKIESVTFDAPSSSLRFKGTVRAEWSGGGYLDINFDVLAGGSQDRNASSNKKMLDYVNEKNAF